MKEKAGARLGRALISCQLGTLKKHYEGNAGTRWGRGLISCQLGTLKKIMKGMLGRGWAEQQYLASKVVKQVVTRLIQEMISSQPGTSNKLLRGEAEQQYLVS